MSPDIAKCTLGSKIVPPLRITTLNGLQTGGCVPPRTNEVFHGTYTNNMCNFKKKASRSFTPMTSQPSPRGLGRPPRPPRGPRRGELPRTRPAPSRPRAPRRRLESSLRGRRGTGQLPLPYTGRRCARRVPVPRLPRPRARARRGNQDVPRRALSNASRHAAPPVGLAPATEPAARRHLSLGHRSVKIFKGMCFAIYASESTCQIKVCCLNMITRKAKSLFLDFFSYKPPVDTYPLLYGAQMKDIGHLQHLAQRLQWNRRAVNICGMHGWTKDLSPHSRMPSMLEHVKHYMSC
nr:uncharacterized protein LOC130540740 [Pan paniscus]